MAEEEIVAQAEDDVHAEEADEPDILLDDDVEVWKGHSRKHERDAKKARKERDDALAQVQKQKDADKSEQDKALDKARAEAKAEAKAESDAERRADRLEVAVTRLSTNGVTVGSGDDAKAVKFADADDVLAYLERAIEKGDIDADDLFDTDSKVQTVALTSALVDLAVAKPHWLAGDAKPGPGENDAGKGSGAAKTLDDQIRAAQKDGDAKELIRLKNQKLFARSKV